MSVASPSHILVGHKYGVDEHVPDLGEIIVVRLSEDLFGPGSIIGESCGKVPESVRDELHQHSGFARQI